ncbi:MAG TPA: rRNA maturation RNase YbeY [Firmicutes bacterium]|nr:rRNA maturation RNase YbeY [Bacillota bacterium]
MAVLVNNLQDQISVPDELVSFLEKIGAFVLRLEGAKAEGEVSIVLVDNSHIHELNLTYRGKDAPTDVLAFNLQGGGVALEEDELLGDVVISMEKAEEQRIALGHTLKREVAFLAVHGILHLLGYDHDTGITEQEMSEKQEFILKNFAL